jgi:hypothetical protein
MPPKLLTVADRLALRRFLDIWRTEAERSGFDDHGFFKAANYAPAGWSVYRRIRAEGLEAAEAALRAEGRAA